MRGSHFCNSIESTVEINGESWQQGGKIDGTLSIKDHTGANNDNQKFGVALAYGEVKKIKKGDLSSLVVEEKLFADSNEMFSWSFALANDGGFTDKKGSYFIAYGELDTIENCGLLELNVDLLPVYQEFLRVFETFLRFSIKDKKYKKPKVQIKLTPSSGKEYANLEHVNCTFSLDAENLNVEYEFNIKSLEYGAGAGDVAVKKKKKKVKQTLQSRDYLIYGDAPNQDKIKEFIEKALSEVEFLGGNSSN